MIGLFDVVELAVDLPELGLARGTVGAVVHVFNEPALAYKVEFTDDGGKTLAMVPPGPPAFPMSSVPGCTTSEDSR